MTDSYHLSEHYFLNFESRFFTPGVYPGRIFQIDSVNLQVRINVSCPKPDRKGRIICAELILVGPGSYDVDVYVYTNHVDKIGWKKGSALTKVYIDNSHPILLWRSRERKYTKNPTTILKFMLQIKVTDISECSVCYHPLIEKGRKNMSCNHDLCIPCCYQMFQAEVVMKCPICRQDISTS
jgi:hypothetical protein